MGEREVPVEPTEAEFVEQGGSVVPGPDVIDAEVADAEEVGVPKVLDPTAAIREDLAAAQARLRTVSKAYTDLQKEMTAFRERMELQGKAKGERQAFETVSAILEPVQNLKRSLAADGDAASMKAGMVLIHAQFMDALGRLGLKEIAGEGAAFDPVYHEALAVSPVSDAALDGRVLDVHRTGYVVNGKVLQAAQVIIGKYDPPAEA